MARAKAEVHPARESCQRRSRHWVRQRPNSGENQTDRTRRSDYEPLHSANLAGLFRMTYTARGAPCALVHRLLVGTQRQSYEPDVRWYVLGEHGSVRGVVEEGNISSIQAAVVMPRAVARARMVPGWSRGAARTMTGWPTRGV